MATVGKGPRHTNGPNRIEAVGVLHQLTFERAHRRRHAQALEADFADDALDVGDQRFRGVLARQPLPGGAGSRFLVAIVKLPVGHVVQQRAELHHQRISTGRAGRQRPAHLPDPPDVRPVVAAPLVGKPVGDKSHRVFNQDGIGSRKHKFWLNSGMQKRTDWDCHTPETPNGPARPGNTGF